MRQSTTNYAYASCARHRKVSAATVAVATRCKTLFEQIEFSISGRQWKQQQQQWEQQQWKQLEEGEEEAEAEEEAKRMKQGLQHESTLTTHDICYII